MVVDGTNKPFTFDENDVFTEVTDIPAGATSVISSASDVTVFKDQLVFSKDSKLFYTAPFTDTDFTAGNGAGEINVKYDITGMIPFRDQLIIFTTNSIHKLTGTSAADFALSPITSDLGCTQRDSIQEVGGDIMFLSGDGVRFLSATQNLNDFGFAIASRDIQKNMIDFSKEYSSINSCVVREKNQYRLFGYKSSRTPASTEGYLATQFIDQSASNIEWSKTKGLKAYVIDSVLDSTGETIIFANDNGYVYRMESGTSFDGSNIVALFYTPYISFSDPRVRKVAYKLVTYLDPDGSIDGVAALKFDLNPPNSVQPDQVIIEHTNTGGGKYGEAVYGVSTYGSKVLANFENQVVGSGFNISIEYTFDNSKPSFSLDAFTLEISYEDRK
jgi:hypothetical protein